jgi:transposase
VLRELGVAEQRHQAVLVVIEDGMPVTAVAEKAGVSRQTVHSWLSRYAGGGPAGVGGPGGGSTGAGSGARRWSCGSWM